MAYDARRGVVVMFGGENNQGLAHDVWEYDGIDWTRRASTGGPPGVLFGAMVFDAAHGAVAMIGGFNSSPDLWEWDGAQWTRYSSPTEPLSRFAPAVSYDIARRTLVVFGGAVNAERFGLAVNDTWEWDGTTWIERAVRTLARQGGGMYYDPLLHRPVVFGGNELNEPAADTGPGMLNDTWSWDGASWVAVSPPDAFPVEPRTPPPAFPSGRIAFATAIGTAIPDGEVIVWGGLDATGVRDDGWVLQDTSGRRWRRSPGGSSRPRGGTTRWRMTRSTTS